MQIAILSDSHDNLENLEVAIDYLNEEKIEKMFFCGDFCSPVPVKLHFARFNGTIDAVFGNTEDRATIMQLSLTEVPNLHIHGELAEFEVDGLHVALTHYPKYAEALARTGDYDLVCHGHNHTHKIDQVDKTFLVNPGEILGAFQDPRFVIFDTDSEEFEVVFVKDL